MTPVAFKFGRFLFAAVNDEKEAAGVLSHDTQLIKNARNIPSFLKKTSGKYLLALAYDKEIICPEKSLRRFLQLAHNTKAGIIYSDYNETQVSEIESGACRTKCTETCRSNYPASEASRDNITIPHPLIDYQKGSIRDDFNFGYLLLFSRTAVNHAVSKYGTLPADAAAAIYDLRLKISLDHKVLRVPEFLYTVSDKKIEPAESKNPEPEAHFAYLAARNSALQKKLEKVATNYLKLAGAYLKPRTQKANSSKASFPVEASVIIPVLNRCKTIGDALQSVLSQKTNFDFNIIIVDNHSTDGTTQIIKELAAQNSKIKHLIPESRELLIGGCWNEAIYSPHCGRYAVQLDSDDLYSSPHTLQKIVDVLRKGNYAMVVGSYTIVDEHLKQIPPGLIDHKEWTQSNGHNNLLRVNGLGAPRAFDTSIIRNFGFPNVSYGEDYSVALRITREYRIGRIYDSLYLCRRWSDNTDAGLSVEKQNRNDFYKDKLRTIEIKARQTIKEEFN